MIEHAKKSMTGYKTVPKEYAHIEGTHIIMTQEEYQGLLDEVAQAKSNAARAEQDAKDAIEEHERQAIEKYNEMVDQANETIRSLNAKVEAAEATAEHYKGLNETLLWISKKRANAERGLRPKTEHSGYAVLSSGETEYVYYTGTKNKVKNTVMLWETVMQTPFSTEFSESQAKRETGALFVLDANRRWEIGKLGITARYKGGYEKMLQDERGADFWLSHNVLLKTRYRANWKAGYWEMVFLHTKSLPGVPEEYRLPKKEKKDKGPKEMKQPKNNKVVPKVTDEEGE